MGHFNLRLRVFSAEISGLVEEVQPWIERNHGLNEVFMGLAALDGGDSSDSVTHGKDFVALSAHLNATRVEAFDLGNELRAIFKYGRELLEPFRELKVDFLIGPHLHVFNQHV